MQSYTWSYRVLGSSGPDEWTALATGQSFSVLIPDLPANMAIFLRCETLEENGGKGTFVLPLSINPS